jgi:uncharacterized membrane protein
MSELNPAAQHTGQRIPLVDEFRGLAVLLMAGFHFCYDLSIFGFLNFEMNGGFFSWLRFLIVTLFFIAVGAGLYLGHSNTIHWRRFCLRELKIVAGALVISLTTYLMYPQSWVWFGVLHFIAVASLVALPFIQAPTVALITGVAIFLLYNLLDWFNLTFLYQALQATLHLPRGTQDLTRLIPWLGMVLIGIYLGSRRFWGVYSMPLGLLRRPIAWLGHHSLLFYLLHQAPLFGLAWLLDWLLH